MTNGFVTRKVARLTKEREEAKARAAALDKAVLRLLGQAIKLTKRKGHCLATINRIDTDMDKLVPRLKCEEVVVAKIMSMPGIGISTKDIEELL